MRKRQELAIDWDRCIAIGKARKIPLDMNTSCWLNSCREYFMGRIVANDISGAEEFLNVLRKFVGAESYDELGNNIKNDKN
jgi:hypothetical protein